jgi:hypothetical protein
MITSLIAGLCVLLCSGFANSYISSLLIEEISTDIGKND